VSRRAGLLSRSWLRAVLEQERAAQLADGVAAF
jgi:hypothetical protein